MFGLSLKYLDQLDPFREDQIWIPMDPAYQPIQHNNSLRAGESLLRLRFQIRRSVKVGRVNLRNFTERMRKDWPLFPLFVLFCSLSKMVLLMVCTILGATQSRLVVRMQIWFCFSALVLLLRSLLPHWIADTHVDCEPLFTAVWLLEKPCLR